MSYAQVGPSATRNGRAPEVSVVVLGYRSVASLERCLCALATHRSSHTFETIVVLNGASEAVREVADRHTEVTVVRSVANRGFGGGCNLGASHAGGRYLVFLNDDAVVDEGWLDGLVYAAATVPGLGAVASLVVDPQGTILEFGGGLDKLVPSALERGEPEYRAALVGPQLVAYASGCSLLIERDLFESLGGFDERFYPVYFEDTDLSRRIWEAGRVVAVTPASTVRHLESDSTSTVLKEVLFEASRTTFERKWAHAPDLGIPLPEPLPRIVYVDDSVPRAQSGSGLCRARMTVEAFTSLGIFVQVHPLLGELELDAALQAAGVVTVAEGSDLEDSPRPLAVVVSRPHNFDRGRQIADLWEGVPLIYDGEALFAARIWSQMQVHEYKDRYGELASELASMLEDEEAIARHADVVVAISEEEGAWFRQRGGDTPVQVLDPFPDRCDPGEAGFNERSNAVFLAGWMSGVDSPNGDAAQWLAREIVPRIREQAPELVIQITGRAPPLELLSLQSDNLRFVGEVPDLAALLNASRVAIAPMRYGAGVKHKVVDALVRGVPVVSTTYGAEGFRPHWRVGMAVHDEPDDFAAALVSMTTSHAAWDSYRSPLLAQCDRHASDLAGSWAEILELAAATTADSRGPVPA